jgi:outer membrane autotransporter protein
MAGYVDSNVDFDSGVRWQFEGPVLGAYATYLNDGFFLDGLLKADLLDAEVRGGALGANTGTGARNFGARIDTGYNIALGGGRFVEPQAMLAGVVSQIDDLDIFGGSVDFEDGRSLRGRAGVRAGLTIERQTVTFVPDLTLSLWQEFAGDSQVSVSPPGLATTTLANDSSRATSGAVALGLNAVGDRWSAFARGHVQFGEDLLGSAARAGLRYSW